MNIDNHQCSSCGKPDCCDVYQKVYTQHLQHLTQLLAQPEADPMRSGC